MIYVHPAFVAQLVTAGALAEDMLRARVTTITRAFEAGVRYRVLGQDSDATPTQVRV